MALMPGGVNDQVADISRQPPAPRLITLPTDTKLLRH